MTAALQIPPLPAAHARALALLMEREVGVAEVAPIIESDPGLTAAALRAANSAESAPADRITRRGDAIVRLGRARRARSWSPRCCEVGWTALRPRRSTSTNCGGTSSASG